MFYDQRDREIKTRRNFHLPEITKLNACENNWLYSIEFVHICIRVSGMTGVSFPAERKLAQWTTLTTKFGLQRTNF